MKTALISGITGQDGSYLAEFLLQKGYEVHGILRRSSSFNTGRIEHLYFDEWVRDMKQKRTINLHYGDMTDSSSLIRIIQQVQPDEIYNRCSKPREGFIRRPGIHSRSGCYRYVAYARSGTHPGTGKENPHLSGFYFRIVR